MPRNQFQRMVFAFLTVLVTVHAYVFYSLYVVNGTTLMSITGESSVLTAINSQGGVHMFGRMFPIWTVILIEFCFAFAFFTQLFFIQPFIRTLFKFLFRKDIQNRETQAHMAEEKGEKVRPINETDAIADIVKRVNEISEEMKLMKK